MIRRCLPLLIADGPAIPSVSDKWIAREDEARRLNNYSMEEDR